MTACGHGQTNLPSVDSVYQMGNYNHHNHSYIIIIILFKDDALYNHQNHMYNSYKLSTKTEQAKYTEENGHDEVTICFAQFFALRETKMNASMENANGFHT